MITATFVFICITAFVYGYTASKINQLRHRLDWIDQEVQALDRQMFRVRFIDPLNRAEHALDRLDGCCGKCKERG